MCFEAVRLDLGVPQCEYVLVFLCVRLLPRVVMWKCSCVPVGCVFVRPRICACAFVWMRVLDVRV